ncbi:MerR family transcriptional regulator [Paenibacillus tengchongensis]|uniref:MerR family transcriptional regulator n=1 Tax=Paenibacillus tengchongensis TaxID=2608684 RepID=UPI00124C36F4|nr:MerR family transcriptional regulator [Paenibacillus tengchongensis]
MSMNENFKDKKVITIGTVCELTGLSARRIRYYEERGLLFPERSSTGNRKYSFSDIEALMEIANQLEDGTKTNEIKKELKRKNMSDNITYKKTRRQKTL